MIVGEPPRSTSSAGENTSNEPGGRVRIAAARSRTAGRPSSRAFFSLARISATPPSAGAQNMNLVSGSLTIGEARIVSTSTASRRQACSVSTPLANAFSATAAKRRRADAVHRHVALDLHREELRGQHQPGFAIPFGQAPVGGLGIEGAARMLVEADRDAEVELARLDRRIGAEHGRSAGRAAIGDVDELQAGQPQLGDHRVGLARGVRAAIGELDVAPVEPGAASAWRTA